MVPPRNPCLGSEPSDYPDVETPCLRLRNNARNHSHSIHPIILSVPYILSPQTFHFISTVSAKIPTPSRIDSVSSTPGTPWTTAGFDAAQGASGPSGFGTVKYGEQASPT